MNCAIIINCAFIMYKRSLLAIGYCSIYCVEKSKRCFTGHCYRYCYL